jgi:hypothetical protein
MLTELARDDGDGASGGVGTFTIQSAKPIGST